MDISQVASASMNFSTAQTQMQATAAMMNQVMDAQAAVADIMLEGLEVATAALTSQIDIVV